MEREIAVSTRTSLRLMLSVWFLVALLPGAAGAQEAAGSFEQLAELEILEPGDRVWVTFVYTVDVPDREVEGSVVSITDSMLTIDTDSLPRGETDLQVDRVGNHWRIQIGADRIRTIRVLRKARRWGMLICGAAGTAVGFALAAEWARNEGPGGCFKCYAAFGALFGGPALGAGWVIDRLRDRRPVVYSTSPSGVPPAPRMTVNPVVTKTRSAVVFSLTW